MNDNEKADASMCGYHFWMLALTIFLEARNQAEPAKIGVGYVIMNRVETHDRYGDTITEVVLKPWQFSCYNDASENQQGFMRDLLRKPELEPLAWHDCLNIAGMVMWKQVADPTDGATHYHDNSIDPPHWANGTGQKIGDLIFYKDVG